MPFSLDTVLAVVLMLAAAVWVGGFVTVAVVSAVSRKTLDPEARVQFFRRFGAAYLKVAGVALVVTYVIGWVFLARLPFSGEVARTLAGSIALIVVLGGGVVQARDLTRLRARAAREPDDEALERTIARRARAAKYLRGLIGFITLALVMHVAVILRDIL